MSVQAAIYDRLINDSTITGYVGTKVFPNFAPQDTTLPFIVYTVISTAPTVRKDGNSPLDEIRLQIDIYDTKHSQLKTIANSIRTSLDGYSGTTQGVTIDRMVFDNESDAPPDLDLEIFAKSQDYSVRLNRA